MRSGGSNLPLGVMSIEYVPDAVDVNDLQDGFYLLTATERSQLQEYLDNNYGLSANVKISKKELSDHGLPSKYSVVIADGKYQLMYLGRKHEKQAGVGAFGVVKYFQNLQTGKFDEVVKIYSSRHVTRDEDKIFRNEYELRQAESGERVKLVEAGMATDRSPITRRSAKKGYQIMKPQQAAKGIEIGACVQDYMYAHGLEMKEPAIILQVFINFALAVKKLHEEKKMLHRDIKPGNVMVDPGTWEVTLVDVGFAIPTAGAELVDDRVGTPLSVAPEVVTKPRPPIYGKMTEAFAFGATIAEVMGMLDDDTGGYTQDASGYLDFSPSQLIRKDPSIQNDIILSRIYDVCAKMLCVDPGRRMDIDMALQELIAIQQLCVEPIKMVAINIADISNMREMDELLDNLKVIKAQEIVLLFDEQDAHTPKLLNVALEFTRAARKRGYLVQADALVIPDKLETKNLQAAIVEHFMKKQPAIKRDCMVSTFVSSNQQKYLDGLGMAIACLPQSAHKEKYLNILADDLSNGVSPSKLIAKLRQLATEAEMPKTRRGGFISRLSGHNGHELKDLHHALIRLDLQHPYDDSLLAKLAEIFSDKAERFDNAKKLK